MLFLLICVIAAVIIAVILHKKLKLHFSFSIVLLGLFGLSTVSAVCLSQNYTQSLVPGINDGIGISNPIAYLIIGERQWSSILFKEYFDMSVYLTLIFLILLIASIIIESIRAKKKSK
jgi:hypothetical protein